jgi:hypothetical protein
MHAVIMQMPQNKLEEIAGWFFYFGGNIGGTNGRPSNPFRRVARSKRYGLPAGSGEYQGAARRTSTHTHTHTHTHAHTHTHTHTLTHIQ